MNGRAASIAVEGLQLSVVKFHCSLRDGQSDTEASGMRAARLVHAIERPEYRV